jgi:TetR/AcrR family transcriptional repressor of nem operon
VSIPESKERLLAAAKELVLAHGYAGMRVDAVCEKAGLTKGSFYHFFKSKEEIGIAILEWSMMKGGEILANGPYTGISDPVERAFGFLEHVEHSSAALWANGCILASFSMELADTSDRLNQVVVAMFTQVIDYFAASFEPVAERWPELPSAKELANEYLALLEGSIIFARVYRDSSRISSALRAFRLNLERLTTATV